MKALVVEDDYTNRHLLETFLAQYGECQAATNGKDAIAVFSQALEAEQRFDLICMDILMPEMDGHHAVMEIRALEQARGTGQAGRARIIMTTALNDSEAVHLALMLDCDAYLLKPLHTGKLLRTLRAFGLVPS